MACGRMQVQEASGYCRGWRGRSKYTRATRKCERHEFKRELRDVDHDEVCARPQRRQFHGWVW